MRRTVLALAIMVALPVHARAAAPTYVMSWTYSQMCSPRGIGIGPDGNVYVGSDCLNPNIERFTSSGTIVSWWQIGGTPNGLAVDASGNVFVAEGIGPNRIKKFSGSGVLLTTWGSTGTGPSRFQQPVGVAVDAAGSVYVSDMENHEVQKFTNNGAFLLRFGSVGTGAGQFQDNLGLAVDALGRIYVADGTRARVLRFSSSGAFQLEFPTLGTLPADVAIGPDGNLYVPDTNGNVIRVFTPDGAFILAFGGDRLSAPWRITINGGGEIYVTEQGNHRVSKFRLSIATATRVVTFGQLKTIYR